MLQPEAQSSASGASGSLAGGIGAIAGIGGSLLNSMFQGIANRRQNKRMVDFWKMNNEYNHPSAQMARLREAGLNPALMYGQSASGAAGNSGSPPSAAPVPPVSVGNPLEAYQNTRLFKLQSDNLRAQNTVLMNDAALKAVNAVRAGAQAGLTKQQQALLEATSNDLTLQAGHKSALMLSQIGESEQRQRLQEKQIAKMVQDLKIGDQNLTNAQKLEKLRELEIKLKSKGLEYFDANTIMGLVTRLLGIPQLR